MTTYTMRTPAEIVERIDAIEEEDYFGFHREVLVSALPYEDAKPYIRDTVTEEDWNAREGLTLTPEATTAEALRYLRFALGKALNHRGLSASRSVEKMTEFAWLLGRDDVVQACEEAEYAPYGAPILMAWAVAYGPDAVGICEEETAKSDRLMKMMSGVRCDDKCSECFG